MRARLHGERRGVITLLAFIVVLFTFTTLMLPAISATEDTLEIQGAEAEMEATGESETATKNASDSANKAEPKAPSGDEAAAAAKSETAANTASDSANGAETKAPSGDEAAAAASSESETPAADQYVSGSETVSDPDASNNSAADNDVESTDAIQENSTSVNMPAQVFADGLKNKKGEVTLAVEVEAPEGAFPEGTTMELKAVKAKDVKNAVADAVAEKTDARVDSLEAVDITFKDADGNEIEPATTVSVKFGSPKIEEAGADDAATPYVVHVDNKGEGAVLDQLTKKQLKKRDLQLANNELMVDVNGFSVYVLAYAVEELNTTYISSEGEAYDVTVAYDETAQIPEGSRLRVTEIAEGTEDYDKARNAVLADKKEKGEWVAIDDFNLAALDISIIDPDGKEIEPAAAVRVEMSIKELPGVENLDEIADTLEVQHHVEVADGVVVEKAFDGTVDGAYEMNTDAAVAQAGTVVDPKSVSDKDFEREDPGDKGDLDLSFNTEAFSTFTVTWTYSYRRNVTVHYGYMDGNRFVEFENGVPKQTPRMDYTSGYSFLIYDIDGYEYDQAYYRTSKTSNPTSQATEITPLLTYDYYGNWFYYGANDYLANNSHIYMVYKKKDDPTTGGTPKVDQDEAWPEGDGAPQFGKSSTNNGDGTNTISLSIKAAEKQVKKATPADVIVVFDVSGSMGDSMNGQTRLRRAKTAVNQMADTLLNSNSDVRMALISFSTTAKTVQGFTNNYNTFSGKVNSLSADGGTNWEQALQTANQMQVRSDAATFVVFVTDGDPTFRDSRGDIENSSVDYSSGYVTDNVFGEGNDDSQGRNFDYAVDQVEDIAGANKSFYAIGISNDVTKVQNLATQAGLPENHAFIASDSTAMENAFKAITESISSKLGFGGVQMTDGITSLTHTRMEVMHSVDANSFKYYRYGGEGNKYGADEAHKTEWTSREAEGCAAATYNEGTKAVEWNMGDGFQLEDGVTYVVTFQAWPSQEAYNLVADLNNGIKTYDSLTAVEKAQVAELDTNPTTYALKTNTDQVNATYKKTTASGDVVSVSENTPVDASYTQGAIEDMPLQSILLTVKKVFEDDLTGGSDRATQVTLVLKRRDANQATVGEFEEYAVPQGGATSANIVLNEANNWTYSLYVAPGMKVGDEVLEHGYDFTITEPGIDRHYDLVEEIINPMVVDGKDVYVGDSDPGDHCLTAINRVKSGIDVKKVVYDTDGTTAIYPDTEFTITGKLLGPDGKPYTWKNGDNEDASGAYHKYDRNGNAVIKKGHFADSSNISFTLKAGETVRFINVPEGCTFEFTESTERMSELGYEWKSTTAVTQHKVAAGSDEYTQEGDVQPIVDDQTAKLDKGVVGNKQYVVTYANKRTAPFPDVELVKVDTDDKEKKLNGATFLLYADEQLTNPVLVDGNGDAINIETGDKQGSAGPDGWSKIGLLPPGTYYLAEHAAPAYYKLDRTPVVVTVAKSGNSWSLTATKNGKSVLSQDETTKVYTITVDNKRDSKWVQFKKVGPDKNALGGAVFDFGAGESTTELTSYAPDKVVEGTNVGGLMADGQGVYTFELPQSDATYTLTEKTAPAGYNMLTDNVEVRVGTTGVTAMIGTSECRVTGEGSKDKPYVVEVWNNPGTPLPNTGGSGTTILYVLGTVMVAVAAGLLLRRRLLES